MTINWAEAIRQKKRIKLNYEPGERLVEPHALGFSKDGNQLVRAYQVEGASASGEHENWKLFRVDRMGKCINEGSCFDEPRQGYRRGDKAMKGGIVAEI
jgi:predicted DNA-binding transcriptional regulator YafY